jgi:DNA polymerase-3 subunit gamma/tau
MSYQVLARKWRPQKFAELVGQEHVVSAISNALDNDKLHHAYLFTGTRGVGKTTIARIFSKSLNCETGQSATPCGTCDACKDIDEGRFVDLLEIDAASRTKVEDTRELLDNVQYKPTRGRFKVYLIDEVHMLSKHSFNALLKTLEEPPPHVKFLLATTDPQKLPVTILSRCLQFSLKALSREQIQKQLEHILTQESIPSDPIALSHLARAAQGSMRDALSLTDQAIAQGNNQITSQIVTDMLGLLDKNQVLRLVKAVIEKDSQEALKQLDDICVHAPDFSQVLSELLSLLHQVSLTQIVPDICKIETVSARAVYQLSKSVSAEHIQLLYQLVLQGKKDLPFAPDAFTGLQMTVLRMLAFSPAQTVELDLESAHSDAIAEKKTADLAETDTVVTKEPNITDVSEVQIQQKEAGLVEIKPEITSQTLDTEPTKNTLLVEQDIFNTSFVDEEADQSMFDEFHELHDEAQIQPENATSLLTTEVTDSTLHTLSADVTGEPTIQDNLTTTSDLLALHELLENEEPEEQANVEVESSTLSLFDRLMKQENSIFVTNKGLPESSQNKSAGEAESKIVRNPLIEGDTPPWDNDTAAAVKASDQAVEQFTAADFEPPSESAYRQDEDDINFNEADDAPYEKAAIISATEAQKHTSVEPEQQNSEAQESSHHSIDMPMPNVIEKTQSAAFFNDSVDSQQIATYEQADAGATEDYDDEVDSLSEKPFLDTANEIAAMFGHAVNDLSNVKVTHPQIAPYLENGDKLLRAKQINKWSDFIEELGVGGLNKQLLLQSNLVQHGEHFIIRIEERNRHLAEEQHRASITETLSVFYQKPVAFEVQYGGVDETPFQIQQQISLIRQQHAHTVVATNDSIQELLKAFEGRVIEGSIKPR